MIVTRFLFPTEISMYGDWLKSQDSETRHTYFGIPATDDFIDSLLGIIKKDIANHHFLVAEDRKGNWIGTIHIAESNIDEVEFGVIVDKNHRGQGVADHMLTEAIVWSRNRGYHSLYMHCLTWNTPIKRLCLKHGLEVKSESGESETKMPLPPADISTVGLEFIIKHRNMYKMLLQNQYKFFDSIYG